MFENVQFGIIFDSKLVKIFKINRFQYFPVIIRIFKRNPLVLNQVGSRIFLSSILDAWFGPMV